MPDDTDDEVSAISGRYTSNILRVRDGGVVVCRLV